MSDQKAESGLVISEPRQLSLFSPSILDKYVDESSISEVAQTTNQQQVFEFRAYQKRLVKDIYSLISSGQKKILTQAPTGSGKTAISARIMLDASQRNKRILFLIHRDPLVEQTKSSLVRDGIDINSIGVVKAGYPFDYSLPIQIASIQTLRKRKLHEQDIHFDLIIIDECHSVCWFDEYKTLKEAYPEAIHIGFTATPWRLSKKQFFGEHFEAIVKGPSFKELIKSGNLVAPRYFAFGGVEDFADIKIDASGDFNEKQMQSLFVQTKNLNKIVEQVKIYHKEGCKDGQKRTGIIFCSGVEHSQKLTQLLNESGIRCEHLEAKTPHKERRLLYQKLESGQIDFLSSVATLTEGFDVPSISIVVLARATKSVALYLQMAGRGVRACSRTGKKDCLILDFGANISEHKYLTTERHISLKPHAVRDYEISMKNCPECNASLYSFQMICPECGYEFEIKDKPEDEELEMDLPFGELFDDDTMKIITYLRRQRKVRYTKLQNPDDLWKTFSERFPGEILNNDWLLGSIFGKNIALEWKKQEFIDYLSKVSPVSPPKPGWIKFHVGVEFGVEWKAYSNNKLKDFINTDCRNWWEILGCEKDDQWSEVKKAYTYLAKYYHPDVSDLPFEESTAKMQIINSAFAYAKQQVKREKESKKAEEKDVCLKALLEQIVNYMAQNPVSSHLIYLNQVRTEFGDTVMTRLLNFLISDKSNNRGLLRSKIRLLLELMLRKNK